MINIIAEYPYIWSNFSTTSHDLIPRWEIPLLFHGNLGLGNIIPFGQIYYRLFQSVFWFKGHAAAVAQAGGSWGPKNRTCQGVMQWWWPSWLCGFRGFLMLYRDPNQELTRWWFQTFFLCTPIWGRWSHFDEHIFQMGWFNHQPVKGLYKVGRLSRSLFKWSCKLLINDRK